MRLQSKASQRVLLLERGGDSPKVLRFSIDINSSVPGSSWAGVFGMGVKRVAARTGRCIRSRCVCV
jgi:hypothetical protein